MYSFRTYSSTLSGQYQKTQPSAASISKTYLTSPKKSTNLVRMARPNLGDSRRKLLGMKMGDQIRTNRLIDSWKEARGVIRAGATRSPFRSSVGSLSELASKGMRRVGSYMEKALINKPVGFSALGIAGVGAAALGVSYGIASMARASKRPPVVHTAAIRSTGQTNQYYNMGADPFGGVRFAAKNRNF